MVQNDLVPVLGSVPGAEVRVDEPLGDLTTYRIGGAARVLVQVADLESLVGVGRAIVDSGVDVVVLGRGSNVLVADSGFDGVVVRLGGSFEGVEIPMPSDPLAARAGSAAALPVVARRTAAAGLGGFEWAVGVPGTIGGAVRMNAGGHGSDMAASISEASVLRLGDDAARVLSVDEIGFGFRSSGLQHLDVVLDAVIGLRRVDVATAEAEIDEIVRWRREHQPGGQNCGSVFVNPVPGVVSAGQLIDGLGLRGLSEGTATVADKHANFILSSPGGAADDVVRLMARVRSAVLEGTGHDLRSEVRLLGFDEEVARAAGARRATGEGH